MKDLRFAIIQLHVKSAKYALNNRCGSELCHLCEWAWSAALTGNSFVPSCSFLLLIRILCLRSAGEGKGKSDDGKYALSEKKFRKSFSPNTSCYTQSKTRRKKHNRLCTEEKWAEGGGGKESNTKLPSTEDGDSIGGLLGNVLSLSSNSCLLCVFQDSIVYSACIPTYFKNFGHFALLRQAAVVFDR